MSGHLRIGDVERDRAAAELAEHYAVGRLSSEEYDERLDAIWTARTRADLDVVFHDLPAQPPAPPQPLARQQGRPGRFLLVLLAVLALVALLEPLWLLIAVGAIAFALTRRRRLRHQLRGVHRMHGMSTVGRCGSSHGWNQQRQSA